jgi:hypothetical protein
MESMKAVILAGGYGTRFADILVQDISGTHSIHAPLVRRVRAMRHLPTSSKNF